MLWTVDGRSGADDLGRRERRGSLDRRRGSDRATTAKPNTPLPARHPGRIWLYRLYSFCDLRDRVLARAAALGEGHAAEIDTRRALVAPSTARSCTRSRLAFPREPVRTLDAVHLSTVLLARRLVTEVVLLSLDERVRENTVALGFHVRWPPEREASPGRLRRRPTQPRRG